MSGCSRSFSTKPVLGKPAVVREETMGDRLRVAGKIAKNAPSALAAKRAMEKNNHESQQVTYANPDSITGTATTWQQAVSEAESLVQTGGSVINPTQMLGKDLQIITQQIRRLLGSGHPVLNTISNYYFSQGGKHIRPLIVLLMSMATSVAPKSQVLPSYTQREVDDAIANVPGKVIFTSLDVGEEPHILPAQRRLAEISEMIHTASLLHDDVIDEAETRRSALSANAKYGNKMAILAGDFLLARASVALARLRNVEVVELLATVISNLVEGEFMQLRNSQATDAEGEPLNRFEYYLEKTYMKTASLIAKSCRASAVLGGCSEEIVDAAYEYGRNLGLAFQIVDDLLDFVSTAEVLGKPQGADLQLGLATAPVLYAAEEFPALEPLIERKFSHPGDVEQVHCLSIANVLKAFQMVMKSQGIERARDLARAYCQKAMDAISRLPATDARQGLVQLTNMVLTRNK